MSERVPLALLPGLLCDDALWQDQVAGLDGLAECRVADFSSQDSVATMAESVLAMMPGRFALAALSMGGYVAFEVLRRAPERVARLALLDTKARPYSPEQTRRRHGLIAMAERIGKAAFLRQQKAILTRPDSRPDLVRISCPTLVLCGRQDALTPLACHTEMAAGIADSRLVVLEDCGHLAPMERPDEVTAALKAWLG